MVTVPPAAYRCHLFLQPAIVFRTHLKTKTLRQQNSAPFLHFPSLAPKTNACVCMLTSARAFSSPTVRAPSSGSPYRNTHTYAHFGTKISVATQETFVLYPRPVGCHPQRSALGLQPVAFLCQVPEACIRTISRPFFNHFSPFSARFHCLEPGFHRIRPKKAREKREKSRRIRGENAV